MTKDRTDTTLADYVGIISRRKWFIGAVALVCAAAALGVSLLAKPTYQATASLNVRDPNQDLTLLGTAFVSGQTPLQLATAHASQIERPAVLQAAGRELTPPAGGGCGEAGGGGPGRSELRPREITAQARHADRGRGDRQLPSPARTPCSTTAQARASYAAAAKKLSQRVRRLNSAQDAGTRAIYIEQLSRLQDLGSVATPVTVNASAAVPGSPSSPKPVRNTAAALIFGLLLGIALAFGRHRFDRRLRSAPDVEGELPYPIVGQIRPSRARALGRAERPREERLRPRSTRSTRSRSGSFARTCATWRPVDASRHDPRHQLRRGGGQVDRGGLPRDGERRGRAAHPARRVRPPPARPGQPVRTARVARADRLPHRPRVAAGDHADGGDRRLQPPATQNGNGASLARAARVHRRRNRFRRGPPNCSAHSSSRRSSARWGASTTWWYSTAHRCSPSRTRSS